MKNKYIYNYSDHLGNTRLSYFHNGSSIEVLEESNYYPFGLKHEGYNALAGNPSYQYQYNGKELQEETGWNDYGARMYMPELGRWGVIDPMAEKYRRWSPYNYAVNNPIMFIDPDGRQVFSGDDAISIGESLVEEAKAYNAANAGKTDEISPPDDHFNQFGQYLYTDNKKTNNIVIDFQNPITGALNTAFWLSKPLTDVDFSIDNNIAMLNNITMHYASKAGVSKTSFLNGKVSTYNVFDMKFHGPTLDTYGKTVTNGGTHAMQYIYGALVIPIMHISKNGNITIDFTNGKIHSLLGDKYNFMSVLTHERNHQLNPNDTELQTYLKQIQTLIFQKTTKDFKEHIQTSINYYEKK